MKKLLLSFLIVASTSVSAQFYGGLSTGYALGAAKRANGVEYDASVTQKNIYGSYGQGMNFNLKLGYMFSEVVGFELGTSYLIGSSQTKHEAVANSLGAPIPVGKVEAKSSGIRLAPQLVLKSGKGLYSRVGLIIPVAGATIVDYDLTVAPGMQMTAKEEYHGTFSLGIIGAIGYTYALSEKLDLFAEVEYVGLSIKSGTAEFTEYAMNGTDVLPVMDYSDIHTEYVDELKVTDNQDPTESTKALRQEAPFSSIGLNIGVVMKF